MTSNTTTEPACSFMQCRRVLLFLTIYTKLCIVPILVINNYCCPEKIMKRFKNNISPDSREYPFKRDL